MHVLVVGAGAVGSYLGWAVAAGGGRTTLVRRSSDREAGATSALRLVRIDGTDSVVEAVVVPSVEAATALSPDLVIVAVRQYDLRDALESLKALPDVPLLTAQNGLGAEDAATEARPGAALLAASVTASIAASPVARSTSCAGAASGSRRSAERARPHWSMALRRRSGRPACRSPCTPRRPR
jgi:2-dehydropantoate 2-reductase